MRLILATLAAMALSLSACQPTGGPIDWSSLDYGTCQFNCDEPQTIRKEASK